MPLDAPEVALEYHPGERNIYANGGAVYALRKYYVLTHVPNTGKIQKKYCSIPTMPHTWTLISEREIPLSTSASDLTWCPVRQQGIRSVHQLDIFGICVRHALS